MNAYIEIVSEHTTMRFDLDEFDLWAIGGSYGSERREFTRENIARWLDRGNCRFEIGLYGWKDFHAVCGDIDIPWATEESMLFFPHRGLSPYGMFSKKASGIPK
jgi:hypothetical protein